MPGVEGFIYPNELELQWSVLIVLYPFITGLVAGAFILASLERVFNVQAVKPTYRLALLTALAFLLVAPLPLQLHLGHPERSLEMYLTPHTQSAMAMFGFVYLWYLMVVLVLEIWLDYRRDIVLKWRASTGAVQAPLRGDGSLVRQHRRGRAAARRPDRAGADRHRDPVGVPAPRLRRVHLRIHQGQPVVVDAADAHRLPVLGDRLGHCVHPAAVLRDLLAPAGAGRHAVRRHHREVPLLRVPRRLLARDARPDPPALRGRRVVPRARLHGQDAAVHVADCRADRPGHPGAARRARRDPAVRVHGADAPRAVRRWRAA